MSTTQPPPTAADVPEPVAIDADTLYHDTHDQLGGSLLPDIDARVAAEIQSRHTAYAQVWQAGREPLIALLEACRERLTHCAEHHGLAGAARRDIRLLVQHIDEATESEPTTATTSQE
jgi:hypothetical protein